PDTYTVTVVNGTLPGGGNAGDYPFDMRLPLTADPAPEGKKFSHWEKNGTVISTNAVFTYYVQMEPVTFTAVYVEETESITLVPFVVLSEQVLPDSDNRIMLFTAIRTVPHGYQLLESGILLLQSNQPLTDELTVETAGVIRGKIKNTSTDQFYIRKLNITPGDTWHARAYLIYQDANGNVITSYSVNTINQTME